MAARWQPTHGFKIQHLGLASATVKQRCVGCHIRQNIFAFFAPAPQSAAIRRLEKILTEEDEVELV